LASKSLLISSLTYAAFSASSQALDIAPQGKDDHRRYSYPINQMG
jgi:hypothetical protein